MSQQNNYGNKPEDARGQRPATNAGAQGGQRVQTLPGSQGTESPGRGEMERTVPGQEEANRSHDSRDQNNQRRGDDANKREPGQKPSGSKADDQGSCGCG